MAANMVCILCGIACDSEICSECSVPFIHFPNLRASVKTLALLEVSSTIAEKDQYIENLISNLNNMKSLLSESDTSLATLNNTLIMKNAALGTANKEITVLRTLNKTLMEKYRINNACSTNTNDVGCQTTECHSPDSIIESLNLTTNTIACSTSPSKSTKCICKNNQEESCKMSRVNEIKNSKLRDEINYLRFITQKMHSRHSHSLMNLSTVSDSWSSVTFLNENNTIKQLPNNCCLAKATIDFDTNDILIAQSLFHSTAKRTPYKSNNRCLLTAKTEPIYQPQILSPEKVKRDHNYSLEKRTNSIKSIKTFLENNSAIRHLEAKRKLHKSQKNRLPSHLTEKPINLPQNLSPEKVKSETNYSMKKRTNLTNSINTFSNKNSATNIPEAQPLKCSIKTSSNNNSATHIPEAQPLKCSIAKLCQPQPPISLVKTIRELSPTKSPLKSFKHTLLKHLLNNRFANCDTYRPSNNSTMYRDSADLRSIMKERHKVSSAKFDKLSRKIDSILEMQSNQHHSINSMRISFTESLKNVNKKLAESSNTISNTRYEESTEAPVSYRKSNKRLNNAFRTTESKNNPVVNTVRHRKNKVNKNANRPRPASPIDMTDEEYRNEALKTLRKNSKSTYTRSNLTQFKIPRVTNAPSTSRRKFETERSDANISKCAKVVLEKLEMKRVRIVNVPKAMSSENLIEKVKGNPWNEILGPINFITSFKRSARNTIVVVLELTKESADKLIFKGHVHIDNRSYLCEKISIRKQCSICLDLNHYKNECKNEQICRYCAENHSHNNCPNTAKPQVCANCKKEGMKGVFVEHGPFSDLCPLRRQKLNINNEEMAVENIVEDEIEL